MKNAILALILCGLIAFGLLTPSEPGVTGPAAAPAQHP